MIWPKICVVMATRNRALQLCVAIDSILKQTFRDFELVIIDDASSDHTSSILKRYQEMDSRIRTIESRVNIGPGAARNLGFENARGEYVAIMDDDDISKPERLQKQIDALQKNPKMDLVFSSVEWIDNKGRIVGNFPGMVIADQFPKEPKEVFELLYLESSKIPNPTTMIRKEVAKAIPYPENVWGSEDWYWYLRLSALGVRMKAMPEPLVQMNRDPEHKKLTDKSKRAFQTQKEVVFLIPQWLKKQKISDFNHLHAKARSNLYTREARHGGMKAMILLLQALVIVPRNQFAWRTLYEWLDRMRKRVISNTIVKVKL